MSIKGKMPVTSSGQLTLTAVRAEAGLSGSITLGQMYNRFFGVPTASQSLTNIAKFYGTVGPSKKVHLDAATLSGSAGTQLTTWAGSDGQPTATAVSGTGSTKPTLQSESSKNHVNISASTQQYFTLPTLTFTFQDASSNPINGLTVFIVARRSTTLGLWERYFDFGNGAAADNILVARPGTNANLVAIEAFNGSTYTLSQNIAANDNTWYVYAAVITNGSALSSAFYLNGTSVSSAVTNGSATNGALTNKTLSANYIGKSNWADAYLNADIREMIVINSALKSTQVTAWSNYLRSKWGV